ncbi:hypothetical protein QR680_011641 [Steinernema hermaphroditum]|uniref:VWFA domain-containing protein n=1 Tax=Steinernema hermaphroditum TaxID=289476 RepID=A0AA39I1H9_9BILA|nr:hypothetical protein QR680_011641 [Steinernema hermaphroditum]
MAQPQPGYPGLMPQQSITTQIGALSMTAQSTAPGTAPQNTTQPRFGYPGMMPQQPAPTGTMLSNTAQPRLGYPGMMPQQPAPTGTMLSNTAQPRLGYPGMIPQQSIAAQMGAPTMTPLQSAAPGTMPPNMAQAQPGYPGMIPQQLMVPQMTAPTMAPQQSATPGTMPPNMAQPQPGYPGMVPQQSAVPGNMAQPQSTPGMPSPRLDPVAPLSAAGLPSVVQVIEDDRSSRSGAFPTGYPRAEVPPLVTTTFTALDQGNCNPKFMRSTLYTVPENKDILNRLHIPFSVTITPFASLLPDEGQPPIVDLGELGPQRCQRCKAYVCAFMEFQDGGRRFDCPFCRSSTAVDENYFCHLDHYGRRTDIQYRPELCFGSYEFIAPKMYCKDNVLPKPPAFVFMLDVSYGSVRNGLLSTFCRNLASILNDLPVENGQDRSEVLIGLVTYDQCLHFYNLGNPSGRPEMRVVNDVDAAFVPFMDGFLVPFNEAHDVLVKCLDQIAAMFADTRITETILGPVVNVGMEALKIANRAGKLFIFHSSLPTYEAPGKLKNREDRKALGTDRENTVLNPVTDFYKKLGKKCVQIGCAVDLFVFPSAFIDLATISPLASVTGGTVYSYQYFDSQRDGQRFLLDLRRDVSRHIGFDAMIRVRTSAGIRPTGFYGSFLMENNTDMELGCIDSDKAVVVDIKHDSKLKKDENVYVQAAILFTSCRGQRKLRIHNLCLPISDEYGDFYRSAEPDTIISHLLKTSLKALHEKSPKAVRDDLNLKCARMLATYREQFAETVPSGQLLLPECLKLLPVYANSIMRHEAFCGGPELNVDDRVWQMNIMESCRTDEVLAMLYPRIFEVSSMSLPADTPTEEFSASACVRASGENLHSAKAYLIENGLIVFLWVGAATPQEWVTAVFNVPSFAALDSMHASIPERDNSQSRAIRRLIEHVNEGRQRRMRIQIVKEKDTIEPWMRKFLVEDKYMNASNSYVDFLRHIHQEVRLILA